MYLEIECTIEQNKNILTKDLQLHRDLDRHFTFITKSIEKQKMIMLAVPSNYVKEHITDSILARYNAHQDEFFTSEYCRQITRAAQLANSHAYLARLIISDGGLLVDFKHCHLHMHTHIQRCRKC